MNSSAETENVRSSPLIKICLVGLPVGLIVTSVISFLFYFSKRENRIEPMSSHLATMFRKEVEVQDLDKYQQVLAELLPKRDFDNFENLEAASSYIDSTMGYDNMGYRVLRQDFLHEGKLLFNLMVELPGKKQPDSIILVVANYVSSKDDESYGNKAISSLFSLANAMTGESLDKTLRFVAVANLNDISLKQSGAWYLSQDHVYPKEVVEKVFYIEVPGFSQEQVSGWSKASFQALSLLGDDKELLNNEKLKDRLNQWLLEIRASTSVTQ